MPTLVAGGRLTIVDTNDGLSSELSKSSLILPAANDGTVLSFTGVDTTMTIRVGGVDDTANWSIYVSSVSAGLSYRDSDDVAYRTSANVGATAGLISGTVGFVKVTALTVDAGYIELTATKPGLTSIVRRLDVVKSKAGAQGNQGNQGNPGTDATTFQLSTGQAAVRLDVAGRPAPATITLSATSVTGSAGPVPYAGRFTVEVSSDLGVTWVASYTSAANESSKVYTVPTGQDALRVRLYAAGGTTTLLEEKLVPMVPAAGGQNLLDTSWMTPGATIPWTTVVTTSGATSVEWGIDYKGERRPMIKGVGNNLNLCVRPDASGSTSLWFAAELTGTALTAFATDATAGNFVTGNAFKLTKNALATNSQGRASRMIPVTPGQVYRVRVSVKGDTATASGVYIRINEATTAPAITAAVTSANRSSFTDILANGPAATTFTTHSLAAYTVPAGVTAISLSVYSWANGPVNLWLDDPVVNLASGADQVIGPREGSGQGGVLAGAVNSVVVDTTKTYRFVSFFKRESFGAYGPVGNIQVGFGADQCATLNTATLVTSPYCAVATAAQTALNTWYMVVGYVYPAGSTGMDSADSGVYDMATGIKVSNGTNFCFANSTVPRLQVRHFQTAAEFGATFWLDRMMVHLCDGTQPPLRNWLAIGNGDMAPASINSANIDRYLASVDWDGVVDALGKVTTPGTKGWVMARGDGTAGSSKLEVDAAHIRGTLTASQINSNGLAVKDPLGNIILDATNPLGNVNIGKFIASDDWDGVITNGKVTTPGTKGWVLAKGDGTANSSKLEVDAATIRGQLSTSQLLVGSVTSTAITTTAGTTVNQTAAQSTTTTQSGPTLSCTGQEVMVGFNGRVSIVLGATSGNYVIHTSFALRPFNLTTSAYVTSGYGGIQQGGLTYVSAAATVGYSKWLEINTMGIYPALPAGNYRLDLILTMAVYDATTGAAVANASGINSYGVLGQFFIKETKV